MELKKCEGCQKAFFGERGLTLCPICAVVEKGNRVLQRPQAASQLRQVSAAPVAAAM
jgi:uncharacterized Zn finger protein (UPF0148 family)